MKEITSFLDFDLKELIGKLNPTCRKTLEDAAELCVAQTNYSVEIEHWLLKLLEPPDTNCQRLLRYYEVNSADVTAELTRAMETFKRGARQTPTLSPYIPDLLQEAWLLSSSRLGSNTIRSGGLLLALLENEALRGILKKSAPALLAIPHDALGKDIRELLQASNEGSESEMNVQSGSLILSSNAAASETSALNQYTINLTARAAAGEIDPVRCRDFEIRQIIDILMRRRQNNPILTGEAGVGKTAVVEGFALRIASGDVPPSLQNTAVRILDLGLLQAGAGIRGEFEDRLKSVIAEVKGSVQPIILFIDEAHTLIGAGRTSGQGDAANLLKPALARGELRTIAATTWSEYKRYFEKDPALARRFQVIKVEEPDEDAATEMLRTVAEQLEKHHDVRILDEAIRDAVKLSHRYISGRYLPDKAVSVLDTACARVSIGQNATPPTLEDAIRHGERLEMELSILEREEISGRNHSGQIEVLHAELEKMKALRTELQARWEKERMLVKQIRILQNELEKRAKSPEREEKGEAGVTVELLPPALHLEELTREIIRLEADLKAIQGDDPMVPIDVDSWVIASVVSGWTGIPVGKMLTNDIHTILNLRQKLAEQIIGQPRALDTICRRLQAAQANLSDPGKPVGVFLLVGTSGVGKTETAIALAELLYGGERNMVVVNMSEYQEAHTISALKGAPPGYVGYGTGGILTEAVRRNPYTLVLLDEAEKAHTDVKNLFYQVFDKGVLEDAEGAIVDFRNTIILLTCNLEAETMMHTFAAARQRRDVGFLAEPLRHALLKHFTPAFLGRLVVVPYQPLGEDEIREIVKLKLAKIRDRFWENHGANLSYDEKVVAAIAARCTEVDSGARNVDHILTHTLLPKLSEELLECMALGEIFSGIHVALDRAKNFVLQAMISPPSRAHPSRASRGEKRPRKKRENEIQRAKDE